MAAAVTNNEDRPGPRAARRGVPEAKCALPGQQWAQQPDDLWVRIKFEYRVAVNVKGENQYRRECACASELRERFQIGSCVITA